jgi:hypothetical protein
MHGHPNITFLSVFYTPLISSFIRFLLTPYLNSQQYAGAHPSTTPISLPHSFPTCYQQWLHNTLFFLQANSSRTAGPWGRCSYRLLKCQELDNRLQNVTSEKTQNFATYPFSKSVRCVRKVKIRGVIEKFRLLLFLFPGIRRGNVVLGFVKVIHW